MANPVYAGHDAQEPVIVPAGQWSEWITVTATDPDAVTADATVTVYDTVDNPSDGTGTIVFEFPDPLRAGVTFPADTPALVEYDPQNPLRFRVRNTNA